ncbi:MAG TPA: hypothetical protein VGD79_06850 [Thermoanaerobaculia bacterium]
MNTKLVLSASAVVLGIAGIAASFMPHELLRAAGIAPAAPMPLLVQLLGALWFAFAMVNWTARGSLIGGIYNRPIAIGNLTHFVIGAFALGKDGTLMPVAIVYALFAIAFAMVFFRSPVSGAASPSS